MSNSRSAVSATFDDDAVARAEAALKALSINFQAWMTSEVDLLDAARQAAHAAGDCAAALEALNMRAHDVKGLGSTYDYPLVTGVAHQLCRLLETPQGREAARAAPNLIDAHVDAIRAIVRSGLRGEHDATGRALLNELTARVDRWARQE